jgi:hypothetical protein
MNECIALDVANSFFPSLARLQMTYKTLDADDDDDMLLLLERVCSLLFKSTLKYTHAPCC